MSKSDYDGVINIPLLLGPENELSSYFSTVLGHPVMKTFPHGVSVSPTVTSNEPMEPLSREGEDKISELQEDTSRTQKRLLPDRSHAAHDRANEKLVNFIVKQRMAEERLLVGYTHDQSDLNLLLQVDCTQ